MDRRRSLQESIDRLSQPSPDLSWIRFEGSAFLPGSVYTLLGSPRIPFAATQAVLFLSSGEVEAFKSWAEAWSQNPGAVEARAENRRSWGRFPSNSWAAGNYRALFHSAPRASCDFLRQLYKEMGQNPLADCIRPRAFGSHLTFEVQDEPGQAGQPFGILRTNLYKDRYGIRLKLNGHPVELHIDALADDTDRAISNCIAAFEHAFHARS